MSESAFFVLRNCAGYPLHAHDTAVKLDAATPFGRVTRPQDVAAVVAFFVSSGAEMVTGQRIEVNSGTPLAAGREG